MSPNIGSGVEYANHAPFIARGAPDESQVKCHLHLPTGAEVEDVLSLDCATRPCRELTPIAHVFLRGREVDDEDPEGGGGHGVPHLCHPLALTDPPCAGVPSRGRFLLRRLALIGPGSTGHQLLATVRSGAVSSAVVRSAAVRSVAVGPASVRTASVRSAATRMAAARAASASAASIRSRGRRGRW